MRRQARSRYGRGLAALMAPFGAGTLLLVLGPLAVTSWFAFTRYDGLSPADWVGLDVFRSLADDPEFHDSLRATGWFLLLAVPLRVIGGLALALLLHRRERLTTGGRVSAYLPVVVPDAAMALVWLWVVNPVYGPVGALVRALGGDDAPLLDTPWGARLTIVAIAVLALGEGFLVMLAARRELPPVLYDAARLEGAGGWATFRRVTLPMMTPVLGLVTARDLLTSMQVTLVPTLLLTRGGPLNATKTLPVLAYEKGFRELRFGDGAAVAVVLLVSAAVLAAVQLRLLRRWSRT